jgi:hypothetical protein
LGGDSESAWPVEKHAQFTERPFAMQTAGLLPAEVKTL